MKNLSILLILIFISCTKDDPAPVMNAEFEASNRFLFTGDAVVFTDLSTGNPTDWEWTFIGAKEENSNNQNPTVIYEKSGEYSVILTTASNDNRSDSEKKINYMNVMTKPLVYFPLNGNTVDSLGSGITGTISGASLVADADNNLNSAYDFDGADDHIDFGDVLDLDSADFTISLWTKVDEFKGPIPGTNSAGAWMIAKGITIVGQPSRAGFALRAEKINNENHFIFMIGGQTDIIYKIQNADNYQPNVWYHIVGRRSCGTISLFIDGEPVEQLKIPENLNVNTNIHLALGRINKFGFDPNSTTYFDGSIDEVKIYKTALEDNEILKLAKKH